MYTSITVELNTGEYNALRTVMVDPLEWTENMVKNRARLATIDIVKDYTLHKTVRNEPIVAVGSTAIIQSALDEGTAIFLTDDE